jgi:hypothetical protein
METFITSDEPPLRRLYVIQFLPVYQYVIRTEPAPLHFITIP